MGSEGDMGMNLELRVQKAQPDVAPAAPRRAVVKVLRRSPIVCGRGGGGEKVGERIVV